MNTTTACVDLTIYHAFTGYTNTRRTLGVRQNRDLEKNLENPHGLSYGTHFVDPGFSPESNIEHSTLGTSR